MCFIVAGWKGDQIAEATALQHRELSYCNVDSGQGSGEENERGFRSKLCETLEASSVSDPSGGMEDQSL